MSVQIQTFALIHLQEKNKEIACPSLDTIDISQKYENEWMWEQTQGKSQSEKGEGISGKSVFQGGK